MVLNTILGGNNFKKYTIIDFANNFGNSINNFQFIQI